jgi:hypothetical protein
MNTWYYYGATLIIYILEVLLAIYISDVGIVFQISAAISGSSVQFIWPGYFFLHSEKKYGTKSDWEERKFVRVMAWLYLIAGICLLFTLLGGTVFNIIRNSQE